MPIEPTEPASTHGTDRRAFLTRSAAGGALVATVASTGLAGLGLGVAGAQEGSEGPAPTVTQEYVAEVIPLELAASIAYQSALSGGAANGQWASDLRQFQRNHQDVAEALAELLHPDAEEPVADPAVVAQFSPPPGADEAAVLPLLASLEEALAATHLSAIASFDDSSFAKTIAQALAVEEQQAVVLARAAGTPIEELTPATAPTDGGLEAGQPVQNTDPESDNEADTGGTQSGGEGEGGSDSGTGGGGAEGESEADAAGGNTGGTTGSGSEGDTGADSNSGGGSGSGSGAGSETGTGADSNSGGGGGSGSATGTGSN